MRTAIHWYWNWILGCIVLYSSANRYNTLRVISSS